MDFVVGIPSTKKGHEYLFVLVDIFINMFILMACTKIIKGQEQTNLFNENLYVQFGIPISIILDRYIRFLNVFLLHFGIWTLSYLNLDLKNNGISFNSIKLEKDLAYY